MKANELRIGNLVYKNGNSHIITSNNIHEMFCSSIIGAEYFLKPITLTEEWLLKFGFEKKYNKKKEIIYKKLDYFASFDYESDNWDFSFYDDFVNSYGIYSVHQLQNLYFALTGKELQIIN